MPAARLIGWKTLKYLVRITNYDVYNYALLSSLLLITVICYDERPSFTPIENNKQNKFMLFYSLIFTRLVKRRKDLLHRYTKSWFSNACEVSCTDLCLETNSMCQEYVSTCRKIPRCLFGDWVVVLSRTHAYILEWSVGKGGIPHDRHSF